MQYKDFNGYEEIVPLQDKVHLGYLVQRSSSDWDPKRRRRARVPLDCTVTEERGMGLWQRLFHSAPFSLFSSLRTVKEGWQRRSDGCQF